MLFGRAAHERLHALHHGGGRIEPLRQALAVGVHVRDRLARDAAIHRRLRHIRRNFGNQPRIERGGDDVVRAEFQPLALIGGGDFVGHVLLGQFRQRARGGDLHLLIDGARAHIERAAEDVRKAQHVIDLVRIVRTAGGDDGVLAHFVHFFRRDLRIGIGHGEDDRLLRHRLDHLLGHRAGDGKPHEHVGAFERFGERARLGVDGVRGLELIHAFARRDRSRPGGRRR